MTLQALHPVRGSMTRLARHAARLYSTLPDAQAQAQRPPKVTLRDLAERQATKQPITMLTAHDYASACYVEKAGNIDICLVGDSLAMVACGYPSTVQLSMQEMLFHCRAVARGAHTPLLVADMPFGSYHVSEAEAARHAVQMIQEGDMDGVKIEGGLEVLETIDRLTSMGIPVMGHVGLLPQRQTAMSGYRVQGRDVVTALHILEDAKAVAAAGAFAVVLEAVPHRLAALITSILSIPTIGIGAGSGCSGQVLVQQDALGGFDRFSPRFAKKYMNLAKDASAAIRTYGEEVRSGVFPRNEEHGYGMKEEEWHAFLEASERLAKEPVASP